MYKRVGKRGRSKNRLDVFKRYTKTAGLRINRVGGRVLSKFGTRVADFGLSGDETKEMSNNILRSNELRFGNIYLKR